MSADTLSSEELRRAVSILTQSLQHNHVTFGIIGGAGCSLIFLRHHRPYRGTKDIDVIIQADPARQIDADRISQILYTNHSQDFVKKDAGYGVFVPAVRITGNNGLEKLVEVEIFDFQSWPNRPQYDLSRPDNDRINLNVGQATVAVLSPRWLLREKILSQHQRGGSLKEQSDLSDIRVLLGLVQAKCLTFSGQEQTAALKALLNKLPELREALEAAIECTEVFNPWQWSEEHRRYYRYNQNGTVEWATS
ncbi:uncharacterized protein BDR25DRAFT_342720 [Lindgomyces ingoldianus]|uniref:Uncharacterized protein n=1 Tax=Lindgomyces ingoldianus TaxID=673940 RepID=A0ACB6QX83_9PLEO|nr:uncharacterized protein BDR25DRAFT_342720 [Lindgomyces ingoldianus]KAF2470892.1 hypothetical protein BDR25DRAFT_342720 [Lindgomyces ingoldianus]